MNDQAFPPAPRPVAMSDWPLDAVPLLLFDVETTGLRPANGDRIVEIAMLRMRYATLEASFSSLVNPERASSPQAQAIHGIPANLLADAPHFADLADTVLAMLAGTVLVAHNAPFDVAFLETELALAGRPLPTNSVIDTLTLARRLLSRPSYSLYALAGELNLAPPTHRALSDVFALQGVYRYLRELMGAHHIITLNDLLRFQRGVLPGQPEPVAPPIIGQALSEGRCLRIAYRSRSSPQPTERTIRPLELTSEHSGLFLRAYCFLRNDIRSFAINKIEQLELLD
jgi:DNA polymerase III subunit epsilon